MATAYRSSTSIGSINNNGGNITLPSGSIAGDTIFVYYAYVSSSDSGTTISASNSAGGMTRINSERKIGTFRFSGLFYCTLTSTDISNGYVSYGASNSFSYLGNIFAISVSGETVVSLINGGYNTDSGGSPTFSNSLTPVAQDGVLLMFVFSDLASTSGITADGYAVATDNPTFTEIFDELIDGGSTDTSAHIAYSNTRTSTNATGNSTMTFSSGSPTTGCFIVLIESSVSVVVSGSVGNLTLTGNAGSISTGSTISGSTGMLTLTGNAGTHSSPTPVWDTQDKSSDGTWTNQSKS